MITLPRFGLGTWAFGGRAYGPLDDQEAVRIVEHALSLGISFFDTAAYYGLGRSEEILGQVLPADAVICTKIGTRVENGKVAKCFELDFLEHDLASSLSRLKRDSLPILLLHNAPIEDLKRGEVFLWLERKKTEGVIQSWGVSLYDDVTEAKLALAGGAQIIEARYSLFRRDILPALGSSDEFQFIARSPLDSGLLTGKYGGQEQFAKTDMRSGMKHEYMRAAREALDMLEPLISLGIADSYSELALRFSGHSAGVGSVIPGAKSVEQLDENFRAFSKGPLPVEALAMIESAKSVFLRLTGL